MEAKLTFNLPDENSEFTLAVHGVDFYNTLSNIDNVCRAILKGDIGAKDSDIEHIREMITETSGFYDVE